MESGSGADTWTRLYVPMNFHFVLRMRVGERLRRSWEVMQARASRPRTGKRCHPETARALTPDSAMSSRAQRRISARPAPQQPPRLNVPRIFLLFVPRSQPDIAGQLQHHPRRQDVPNIFRQHIESEKINFVQPVIMDPGSLQRADESPLPMQRAGRFHLHPPETPLAFDRHIVPGGISPRLRHAKPAPRRSGHEKKLDPFATLLVSLENPRTCHSLRARPQNLPKEIARPKGPRLS